MHTHHMTSGIPAASAAPSRVMAATATGSVRYTYRGFICCVVLPLMTVLAAQTDSASGTKTDLFIVSMLPYPVEQEQTHPLLRPRQKDGPDIIPAVHLAVDQINNRTDILNDYTLHLLESDGGCNVKQTTYYSIVSSIYDFIDSRPIRVGVIGPRCSDSALITAPLVSMDNYPITCIHLGTVPTLGDRTRYPYMFGIVGSASLYAEALVTLMVYNEWTQISTLYSDTDIDYYTAQQELNKEIVEHSGYSVALSLPVSTTYLPLQEIRNSYTRVIFAFVDLDLLLQLMCLAYHDGLIFPTYQWVIPSVENFTQETRVEYRRKIYYCSESEILAAIEGAVTMVLDLQVANDTVTDSRYTYSEYIQQYELSLEQYSMSHLTSSVRTVWANPVYDAIWALALALNAADEQLRHMNLSLSDYHDHWQMMTQMIADHIYNHSFTGVSGRNLSFQRSTGFANRTYQVYQFASGRWDCVGYYDGRELIITGAPMFVSGEFESVDVHVSQTFVICVLAITTIPLLLTVFAQTTSIIYRRHQPIKASSYRLNHFAYIGCYTVVASIVLYTVREAFVLGTDTQNALCLATEWSLNIGLTLILGTMCMKSWRLYRIFTASSKLKPVKNPRLITDTALSVGLLVLVSVDIVICTVRTAYDPFVWNVTSAEVRGTKPPSIYTVSNCESEYGLVWLSLELGYEGLIVLFSFVVTFFIRRIGRKGMQVKNVIILAYILTLVTGITFPLIVIVNVADFGFTTDVRYAISSTSINAILYVCVAVLFIPPVVLLFKEKWNFGTINPRIRLRTYSDMLYLRPQSVVITGHPSSKKST